jgi:outer membrane immunogenic protein
MWKLALGAVFGALVIGASAQAADFGRAPATYSPPTYNWFGPYVGANLGYQWGSVNNSGASPSGLTGGVQAGINWQSGQFVYGLETDLQLSGADDVFAAYKFSNPWFGTTRARAGYALNNILFFGTFGFAYGETEMKFLAGTESHSHLGLAVGAGAEIGITQNWTAKAEYLFLDFSNERFALTGLDHDFQSSIIRFGINYKF